MTARASEHLEHGAEPCRGADEVLRGQNGRVADEHVETT